MQLLEINHTNHILFDVKSIDIIVHIRKLDRKFIGNELCSNLLAMNYIHDSKHRKTKFDFVLQNSHKLTIQI